jgi:pimeloyl-ACP methyl ester carboxylesterase
VVGIHPNEREREYTQPGYEDYGRFLVETLKPMIDGKYRTLRGPENTAAMGSSLGGVVSFYLGWQWPKVFGKVACLSSTFTFRDDLIERVAAEPKRSLESISIAAGRVTITKRPAACAIALSGKGIVLELISLTSTFQRRNRTKTNGQRGARFRFNSSWENDCNSQPG